MILAFALLLLAQTPTPVPAATLTPEERETRVWAPASTGIRENRVAAIAANPLEPKQVLAATFGGTLYRSNDRGRTWEDTFRMSRGRGRGDGDPADAPDEEGGTTEELSDEDLQELEDLRDQVFQDVFDDLLEAVGEEEAERLAEEEAEEAVEELQVELEERARERREEAEGDSEEDAPPARLAAIRQIVWDPTFPGLVYLATRDGVWRSGDAGGTFTQLEVGVGDEERDVVSIAPSAGSPDRIVVGTAKGVLVSDDGGLSWSNAQGEPGATEARVLALDPEDRGTIALGTISGAFVSGDGGETWRKVWNGTGDTGDVRALAFAPGDRERLLLGTAEGIWAVSPGQTSPAGVAQFASNAIRAIAMPAPGIVYVATARGVYESRDGAASFAELFRGLATPDVLGLSSDPVSPDLLWAATALGVHYLGPEAAVAAGRAFGPSIRELVRAAEVYSRFDGETMKDWKRQAKWGRLLPRVTATWTWNTEGDEGDDFAELVDAGGDPIALVPGTVTYEDDRARTFLVLLTWNFDRLFSSGGDHLRLVSQYRTVTRQRTRRLAQVARLARERRELAGRLGAMPANDPDRVPLELRFHELTSYLDGATGGAASRQQQRNKEKAP